MDNIEKIFELLRSREWKNFRLAEQIVKGQEIKSKSLLEYFLAFKGMRITQREKGWHRWTIGHHMTKWDIWRTRDEKCNVSFFMFTKDYDDFYWILGTPQTTLELLWRMWLYPKLPEGELATQKTFVDKF